MIILKVDIIAKIRKAIDDIAPSVADSFTSDVDEELWQATFHAANDLSLELPMNLLDATVVRNSGTADTNRGFAYFPLQDDYLRFVSLDITGCAGIIRELMEAGSDEEKMQRSVWGRGTSTKPKAMLDQDETGAKVIMWWPGDEAHKDAELAYIATPKITDVAPSGRPPIIAIECAIHDEAEQKVIYRAASIFFEGKKEGEIADKFRNL